MSKTKAEGLIANVCDGDALSVRWMFNLEDMCRIYYKQANGECLHVSVSEGIRMGIDGRLHQTFHCDDCNEEV